MSPVCVYVCSCIHNWIVNSGVYGCIRRASYNKKQHPLVVSALIPSVQNCIAILTRPTVYKTIIFYSDDRQKIIGDIRFFCYFYRFPFFYFLFLFFLLSWTWIEGCPSGDLQLHLSLSFFFWTNIFLYQTISSITWHPLRCSSLLWGNGGAFILECHSILHTTKCYTTSSPTLNSLIFPSLLQLSSTSDNFCLKKKLWSFFLTLPVIFIIFLLFFLFGGEQ